MWHKVSWVHLLPQAGGVPASSSLHLARELAVAATHCLISCCCTCCCRSQLANVFQRKAASSESATAEWQQEAKAKVVSGANTPIAFPDRPTAGVPTPFTTTRSLAVHSCVGLAVVLCSRAWVRSCLQPIVT